MFHQRLASSVFGFQVFLHFSQPKVGEVAVLRCLEPGPSASVVYGLGQLAVHCLVVSLEEVPDKRDRADLRVVEPLEAVEKRTGLSVHDLRCQNLVLGMATIVEHHGRPVLSGIHSLNRAVHLRGFLGSVIVVDAHHRVPICKNKVRKGLTCKLLKN